ncbi:ATP-binding protein [Kaarinaea lacus]
MIESMLILTGICTYAAANHAFNAFNRPFSSVHFLFAILCLLLVIFELLHLRIFTATTVSNIVSWIKWEMGIIMVFFSLFPWFVSQYTGIRPSWLLQGLTLLGAVLTVFNIARPYGLQFSTISHVEQVVLPWSETVSQPIGQISALFYITIVFALVVFAFLVYALSAHYYRVRTRTALAMLLAIGLFVVLAIESILARLAVIDFVPLGHLSILAMIIAMSLALSQEMQQKLRASEHRFRSLVEQAPFSLQILSPDGRTLQVNRAWENLWGVSLDQFANYNLLQDQQLRDKGVMPYLEKGFAGQAADIPPIIYNPSENPIVKGPSRDRWVRAFVYPIKDDMDTVREVVLLHEDVTEKKRFDDAIQLIATGVAVETGDGYFQKLVANLADLFQTRYAFVGVLDTTNTQSVRTIAVYADGKLAPNISYELEGTPCEKVVGQHTCIVEDDVQQMFPQDLLLNEMGAESYIGTPLFNSTGEPVGLIVLIDSRPLCNPDQMKVIMEIVAARTAAELERSKAEELLRQQRSRLEEIVERRTAELQAAIKELDAFSYSVSHDLRAPLRSIDGFSQALAEDYNNILDDQGQDYLDRIRSNVQRMAILIDDLLRLSRISRKDLSNQPVNLSQLVAESINKQREQDSLREIQIDIAKDVFANGDPDLLAIAIDNLISNAWKYTGKTQKPVIEFGAENKDKQPIYYIKDNGIGFNMQYAEKLFTAFERLHTTSEFEGTGIGLAIVDRIIKRHEGKIWANARPDQGAVFYFSLSNEFL